MELDLDNINLELEDKGIFVSESFVSESDLEILNEEFDAFMSSEQKGARFTPYSEGVCVRVTAGEFDKAKFSQTEDFFYSSFMKKVSENFLNAEPSLNEEIFVVKDIVGSSHIAQDLHYDVTPTLKFFLYLNDTTIENGAFTCVPGSHKRTAEYRKDNGAEISFEKRYNTRELDVQDFPMEVPIEGKKGTLIIFHTDVWHKAGIVSKGDRRVMRGHTRAKRKLENITLTNKVNYQKPSIFRRVLNKLKK